MRKKKALAWAGGILATIVLLVFLAIRLAQEPLRRYMESNINASLKGYSVKLKAVDFQPIGLAVTLHGLRVIQEAHPDPPVADIPYLQASVHWSEIIHARLVADFELRRPSVHIHLNQIQKEAADEQPMEERGWQDAVRAIYPLKINRLTIRDGDVTYIDEDPDRPLNIEALHLTASNIRNIVSPEKAYPSPVTAEAVIFQKGRIRVDGAADFLKEPYPGIKSRVELNGAPLDYLQPILARHDMFISGGAISATGDIEHAPSKKAYRFETVALEGIKLDYRIPGPVPEEKKTTEKKVAKEATTADPPEKAGEEEILYLIEDLRATGSVGLVNTSTDPDYRVFLDEVDLRVNRLSNGFRLGEARAELSGDFMGSGRSEARAAFRPEQSGPDFDMALKIQETPVRAMNDMLRAYGNFDVTGGTFSLFSEVRVEHDRIAGYIKPFFKNLDIYDRRQDKGQGFFHEAYEAVIGGMTALLENEPREQVATRTDFSGKLGNPSASTWQTVLNLVRNAYFKAILPRFEKAAIPGGEAD